MYIFVIIWICWLLSEIVLNRLLRSKTSASKNYDKSSLRFMWISIIVSISVAVAVMIYIYAPLSGSHFIGYSGILLIVSGAIIRFTAIRTLGKFFTVDLALHDGQRLVKDGLYKYLRHPSYTGSLLSFIGLGVSFNNWISLLVLIIPILASFLYRINTEERLMIERFGSEYGEYKKVTKRLIPFIY